MYTDASYKTLQAVLICYDEHMTTGEKDLGLGSINYLTDSQSGVMQIRRLLQHQDPQSYLAMREGCSHVSVSEGADKSHHSFKRT